MAEAFFVLTLVSIFGILIHILAKEDADKK